MVVYIHWGRELLLNPAPYQLHITQHLVSLGVHVIIGSHSHVLQQHFYHDNKVVAISLGNFIFPPGRTAGGNNPVILIYYKNSNNNIYLYRKEREKNYNIINIK